MTSLTLDKKYNLAAPWWHSRLQKLGYAQAYAEIMNRALSDQSGSSICDMGAGSGQMAEAYYTNFAAPNHMVLVDPAEKMLDQAYKRLQKFDKHIKYIPQTLEFFKEPDGFDLVLSAHTIECCDNPISAMHKLAKLTKPGGRVFLVISRPHICQWLIWLKWRHRWFSRDNVLQMARSAGLGEGKVFTFNSSIPARTSMAYLFHPKTPKEIL